jgi:hypothetical protein
MNCYECLSDQRATPAVGVCRHCGAGLCATHVRIRSNQVQGAASPGKVTHEHSARKLLCGTCLRAEEETA